MTTYFQYVPNNTAPYEFQPTLDGQAYIATVTWSFFGVRYYVNLYQADGTLVFSLPLVGSPIGTAIQSLTWENGYVRAKTIEPHGLLMLATINLSVSNCAPAAYNGEVRGFVTKEDEVMYPLATNPGKATMLGRVDHNVNLAAGYFTESTLVYREPSQQFEVTP